MKKKLSEFSDLLELKRNEKLQAESCYLLSSESVASCTYFETKRDILRAHKMFNKHLSQVLDILNFIFTPDGWLLVVTIKSEEDILSNLKELKYSSKKIKTAIKRKNISIIISECIRYAISGIVRITNRYNRRLGTLVRRNFSRHIFLNVEAATHIMKAMKSEQLKLCFKRERYRPSMAWFDIKGELQKIGDVFLCAKNHGKSYTSGKTKENLIKIIPKSISGLSKIISDTLKKYFAHYKLETPDIVKS